MDLDNHFSSPDIGNVVFRTSSGSAANSAAAFTARAAEGDPVVIIHGCPLYRDCFMRAVVAAIKNPILAYSGAHSYLQAGDRRAALLILCISGIAPDQAEQQLETLLAEKEADTAIVVVGDHESSSRVRQLIGKGIRGYIPTSLHLRATIEALNLIQAGGTFAPADSLLERDNGPAKDRQPAARPDGAMMFTAKQTAVIEAIRRGKANKVIAYELNMCESTVKVHVRNIMKKLQAKNRTQVALLTQHMVCPRD
jgi:DNA-binding NarL/FixJ family response regulator